MDFKLIKEAEGSKARAGLITTDHGTIETPIFMPVGTLGAVKGVHMHELRDDIKAQIILGNTYHLYLRPGMDIISRAGGLHKFNGWDRPILTDSGGFQVFSLSANRKLTEEGAHFRSHIDGSKHLFTPEKVVDIQRMIGSDIMMALDECPPGTSDYTYAKKSLELTKRWLLRGWNHFRSTTPLYGHSQAFFPIVQGCTFADLRRDSAKFVADLGAEGNAIGGLAVGALAIGGCAVGAFSCGGFAYGSIIAVGDVARGGIAVGDSSAEGSVISVLKSDYELMKTAVYAELDKIPKFWSGFTSLMRSLANNFMNT